MNAWYTLYTKPNSEYLVAAMLRQQKMEMYLPEVRISAPGHPPRWKPFFPCYLFVNIDLATAGLSALQWLPGTRRLVAFEGQPVAVPDSVIDFIRVKLETIDATRGLPPHPFKPGDVVRITGGPFEGLQAVFEGPTTPAERVQVLLEFLGHTRRVKMVVTDLEKTNIVIPPVAPPKRPRRTRGHGRQINYGG